MNWKNEAVSRYVADDNGKVLYYNGLSGIAEPYRWDYQTQCWYPCSGMYTYRGIKRLESAGKVKFFFNR